MEQKTHKGQTPELRYDTPDRRARIAYRDLDTEDPGIITGYCFALRDHAAPQELEIALLRDSLKTAITFIEVDVSFERSGVGSTQARKQLMALIHSRHPELKS